MLGLDSRRALSCAAGLLLLCAGSLTAQPTLAQEATPAAESVASLDTDAGERSGGDALGPKVAVALSLTGALAGKSAPSGGVGSASDIEIDGVLDEHAWEHARFFDDFRQRDPEFDAPPSQRTEVAFAYDEAALYVAGRMHDTEPSAIDDQVTRRDQGFNTDIVLFSFDTYGDERTAYTFAITAGGARLDWYHPQDREYHRDFTYDPVWEAEARRDSIGWTVEARIPLSQLRFNEGVDEWGLNVNRYLPERQEDLYWVVIPREEPGWSSEMGTLTGLAGIEPRRRLEVSPYVAGDVSMTSASLVNPDDPFASSSDFNGRFGADLKYGLGPNLTLDATVNPDFGQVEADPAIVNLSAFETFFPERRPFFTEGANLFTGGNTPRYFYSRRIGARPHGFAGGDYADAPDVTTILGAAKLSGRLGSGLSIGALGALTAPESATTFDAETNAFGETRVEPTTGYGIVRLQQEFGAHQSTVGFLGTAVTRSFAGDDPTRGILAASAFTGGGDFNLRLDGGRYEIQGHAGISYVRGSEEAIASVQRGSTHYFQRPDQDHVTYDPTRTSLLGLSASLQASKNSGEHWLWNVGVWGDSPNWELNDIGRLNRADDIQSWGGVTYRETEPGSLFRSYGLRLGSQAGWDFGGTRTGTNLHFTADGTFTNYWSANLRVTHDFDAFDNRLTRGGPLMGRDAYQSVNLHVNNNSASKVRLGLGLFWGNQHHGDNYNASFDVTFEPTDQLRVTVGPEYSWRTNRRQFYGHQAREGGGLGTDGTFGTRYLFSTIERSQLSLPIRMNYAFDPDLSLELWAQPFAASGNYTEFGELPAARSFDLRSYGSDGTTIAEEIDPETGERFYRVTDGSDEFTLPDRSFNRFSFRSNLVMRWELSPGSTLFVVWQQNLSESTSEGVVVRPGSLLDAFGAPGSNTLAVKMSYWLPM